MSLLRCDRSENIWMCCSRRSIMYLSTLFTGFWFMFLDKWPKTGNNGDLLNYNDPCLNYKKACSENKEACSTTILFSPLQLDDCNRNNRSCNHNYHACNANDSHCL